VAQILLDTVIVFFFIILVGIPAWVVTHVYPYLVSFSTVFALPLLVLSFVLTFIALIALLGFIIPRPKPGKYPFPFHWQTALWVLHFGIQRVAMLPTWRILIMSVVNLRYLFLRALGAKVAYNFFSSSDIALEDAYMLTIKRNALLGGGSEMAGHFIKDNYLILARSVLEENAELHSRVIVGPGCTIGKNATVGLSTVLGYNVQIGEGTRIGTNCFFKAGIKVGNNVTVGDNVTVEPGVTIADNVRIPPGTWIRMRTKITADMEFEDTRWQSIRNTRANKEE
jgi:acetyltransferase-like isoleucine patch superfamily enzyme